MSQPIRALPTNYNGIDFRSRLEARWAVWLDAMKVKWTYEPEGFTDGTLSYLPDFYLHKGDSYIEIKPIDPTDDEIAKGWLVVKATKRNLYFCVGMPPDADDNQREIMGLHWARDDGPQMPQDWVTSTSSRWALCIHCGTCRPATMGMTERLHCCKENDAHSGGNDLEDWKINHAADKARGFNFLGDR